MSRIDDALYMDLALALARAQQGRTAPNPAVGCVLVKQGRIVAVGATQDGGRPHAERVALDRAGSEARGATAYVTLEPCAHHGQTPPCAEGLIEAEVGRVVIACQDKFPAVAGKGIAMLEAAGIQVETGSREADALALYAGFFHRLHTGLPLMVVDARLHGYDGTLTAHDRAAADAERQALGAAGKNRIRVPPDHPLASESWDVAPPA